MESNRLGFAITVLQFLQLNGVSILIRKNCAIGRLKTSFISAIIPDLFRPRDSLSPCKRK